MYHASGDRGWGLSLMNIDPRGTYVDSLDDGGEDFRVSLHAVLARIAPLTVVTPGLSPQERIQRLAAAVNAALDALDGVTGMAATSLLADLIERLGDLMVTGDNVEVQMSVAGDLRVDRHNRLAVDDVIASSTHIPAATRPAVLRETVRTIQRLLSLLLLHGWAEGMDGDPVARQEARRAIVETVQGRAIPVATAPPIHAVSTPAARGLFQGIRRLTR